MKVEADKVVSIDYTLKNDQGEVLDTSEGNSPLSFIYGKDNIVSGLESALEGKTSGDELSVSIEPKDGYGEYDEAKMFEVGKDQFQDPTKVEEGIRVQGQTAEGQVQVFTIKSIGDEKVTLDANHPLAGERLHFDVAVTDVREATAEEIDHGQVN